MATSKIKPIKATLRKAIDYIINPEKTKDGTLVSSFGCSPETADIEMQMTESKGSKNGNRIAYHLMQSFSPEDDITPEKALELGKEFVNKLTGGKYEYVIATHVDQGHIHNHIIFNATSFIDHKKYHHEKKDKYRMWRINDKICKENNLSVIENYSGKKGHGKYENEKRKSKESWKQQLENMIDKTIQEAKTFDEFVEYMELEGYGVKRGERLSFHVPGVKKNCRGDRLGEAYTEAAIRARIAGIDWQKANEVAAAQKEERRKKRSSRKSSGRKINLIVDISKNLKAQQSKGYEQALVKGNINTLVKTMNYLIQHDLKTPEDFDKHYSAVIDDFNFAKKNRKKISLEMLDLSEKIKFTQNYKKNKAVYLQSLSAKDRQEFYRNHEGEIVQYKASLIYFERAGINPAKLNLNNLFQEYKSLKQEKIENDNLYKTSKERKYDLDIIKQNIEYILGLQQEEEREKEAVEKEIDAKRNDQR